MPTARDPTLPANSPTSTTETPAAGYRWRAEVSRDAWARAVGELVAEIDYENFKSEVKRVQGGDRAAVYSRVWDPDD